MYKLILVSLLLIFIGCSDKLLIKWDGQSPKYYVYYWQGVDTTLCPLQDNSVPSNLDLYYIANSMSNEYFYTTKLDTLGYVRVGIAADSTLLGVSKFYKKSEFK